MVAFPLGANELTSFMAGPGKKQEILDAAVSLFARYGYEGASVSAIAKAAGVAKSTILHHYPSKKSLYVAVNQAPYEALRSSMTESPPPEADELEQVLFFFDTVTRWLRTHPNFCRLILRLQMDDVARSRSGGYKYWNPLMQPVLEALERGQANGTIAPVDGRMMMINLSNMILHFHGTLDLQKHLVIARNDDTQRAADEFHEFLRETVRRALRV